MAFSNLATNQMVSYVEASDGGFTLKSGQTNPLTQQMLTKDMANTMFNLNATTGSNGIAGNQLMQKSFWESGVVGVSVGLIDTTATGLAGTCAVTWTSPITKYTKAGLAAWNGVFDANQSNGLYMIYNDIGCTSVFQIINKVFKAFEGGVYKSVVGDTHSDNIVQLSTCGAANDVTFSSWRTRTLTNAIDSTSGTITVTGATATFNAQSISQGSAVVNTVININGNSRTAFRNGAGTTNSTTFSLAAGTYSYTISVEVDSGTGSGGIIFTQ